jgi:predicted glycosyltransferase
MTGSVLFYVQHLLGIGHLRRALLIVAALAEEGVAVTLVSGGEPLPELRASRARRVVQLVPIRARDAGFRDLVDGDGRPIGDALKSERRAVLLATFEAAQPDAVLIEAFPFGRRAFRFELDPLIEAARRRRPRALVLCSLRDIVVAPEDAARRRAIVDRVRGDFDCVLVHGDPRAIPLEASLPEAVQIADRLCYTGYVGSGGEPDAAEELVGTGEVLVSAGGGAVGGRLFAAAVEARRAGCLADAPWRLLSGPNLPPAEFSAIEGSLPAGVVLERYRPDFPQMLPRCRVSVSQAGYNTVLDILAARAAAVLVPFAAARETEQSLRARWLAERGVVELLAEDALSPRSLAAAIERAVARRPARLAVDTAGAGRAARTIARMIGRPPTAVQNLVTSPSDDMIFG